MDIAAEGSHAIPRLGKLRTLVWSYLVSIRVRKFWERLIANHHPIRTSFVHEIYVSTIQCYNLAAEPNVFSKHVSISDLA